MARIGNTDLERLKRETDLVELVRASGVALEKRGKDMVGRCPFHDDNTPSLVVSVEKNLWHCMGACQAGGSVIDWVMRTKRVSFMHAVEQLRGGVATTRSGPFTRTLPAPVTLDADDQQLMDEVTRYYHATLKESPEALAYLEKRGLTSTELVDHFQLGFANRTLGLRLPFKQTKMGGVMRTRLQKLGLLRESGHEHFNGSLVIPVLDENGHVQGMYGRKITEGLRPGTPLHLYLPGPHRGVFNVQAVRTSAEIILCEALIDALTFWLAGFRNVTSAYGVEGFTDGLFAELTRGGVRKVLIAFDRDDAGERSAEKVSRRLIDAGLEVLRIQFPNGMDANEYALQAKPAERSFSALVQHAEWMGKGRPAAATTTTAATPELQAAKEEQAKLTTVVETRPVAAEAQPNAPVMPEPPAFFQQQGEDLVCTLDDRRYRVRGLEKNTSLVVLKVNISVWRGERFHVDTLDLNIARFRAHFIKTAAMELDADEKVIKQDVGRLLNELELLQDRKMQELLKKKPLVPVMTDDERAEAMSLLKDPLLLLRVLEDLERFGVVGEEVNKLVAYLAATSRKLHKPLAVMLRSNSGAGKSSLMDAVLSLVPDEEVVRFSAMTGQALYYMGETNLRHKVLALAEEEGAERATYPLKLLQSEGRLQIASTGKDPHTGTLEAKTYRVEGPVAVLQTTTREETDEELLNRCIELTADESREQTRAIHQAQRRRNTLEWIMGHGGQAKRMNAHKNAQRLLCPLPVWNPHAGKLTFPDDRTRLRRDHPKYQALIEAVALLHQYQRPIHKAVTEGGEEIEYVEATLEDVAIANRLSGCVMGLSLEELRPQTRRLLMLVEELVVQLCARDGVQRWDVRFSRREVREYTGWGNTQLKVHLGRLEDLEYVIVHRGSRGQTFCYELAYDGGGKNGAAFFSGLMDLKTLGYDENKSGFLSHWSAPSRAEVGPKSGGGRPLPERDSPRLNGKNSHNGTSAPEIAVPPLPHNGTSYRSGSPA